MTDRSGNEPRLLTAIGLAFAIGSALETGLVVAQWTARDSDRMVAEVCENWTGGPQTAPATCSARPSDLP